MTEPAVWATGLTKHFGQTEALRGVDIEVPRGSVLGLLGHNGAGKTTMVRIFATLLTPTAGDARVAGFDVVHEGHEVRRRIGVTGQYAAIDDDLTGRENVIMIGRLLGLTRAAAGSRAQELLDRFELTGAADRVSRTYSGGMRRRLDLAASMVANPEILFLDEPTTGLDPAGRLGLWEVIGDVVAAGTTVLLTTQYLEEADRLANRIVLLDEGAVLAAGTPAELKEKVGGYVVEVLLAPGQAVAGRTAVAEFVGVTGTTNGNQLNVPLPSAAGVPGVLRALDAAGLDLDGLTVRSPSLDDVFLTLTGVRRPPEPEPEPAGRARPGKAA